MDSIPEAETRLRTFDKSRRRMQDASRYLAGGVNSNFRLGISPTPLVFERADGPYLFDADGNRLIDYYLGMGPMILGHTPPGGHRRRRAAAAERACSSPARAQIEYEAAAPRLRARPLRRDACASTPPAPRPSRPRSGSPAPPPAGRTIVKFDGHYHGWFDNILWSTAPGRPAPNAPSAPAARARHPRPAHATSSTSSWNDLAALETASPGATSPRIIMEAAMCNPARIRPLPGYLEGVREACTKAGTVLIFDEVITGFRLAPAARKPASASPPTSPSSARPSPTACPSQPSPAAPT